MELFFNIISVSLSISAYIILGRALQSENTKLPISSWAIWSVINIVIFSAMLSKGAFSLLMASYMLGTIAICILVLRKGEWSWSRLDSITAIIAVCAMILWAITNDAITAIVLNLLALTASSIPMWLALWHDPKSQSEAPWYIWWCGGLLGLLALPEWTWASALMPVWIFCVQCTTAVLISRPYLERQGENLRGAVIATTLFLIIMSSLIYVMVVTLPSVNAHVSTFEKETRDRTRGQ